MSVIPMRCRTVPGERYPRGNEVIPEGMTFLAGAALTLLAPTIGYCVVVGQLWPLYVMVCHRALGAVVGLTMFRKSPPGILSCVPASRLSPVPSGANPGRLKEAA